MSPSSFPESIWLQGDGVEHPSWSHDQIYPDDVQYVRSDLVPTKWIPGVPEKPEPDRLYAVMEQRPRGYVVGVVIRGGNCNWKSVGIIAHIPLPLSMTQAEAMRLIRRGQYAFREDNK
jgi:hypothetical protein